MGNKPPVKAAIIGTGDEGCQAMIRSHNRDYLNFIGFCDIRPSQQERAVKEFSNHKQYTAADVKKLKKYDEQGGDARRPRRRDGRHRAALVAARPGGHRGDEGRQARLHREADGPLGRRVQGDVPGGPRDEQAAGRRPPAALLGPLRQRQLPAPERRARRRPPHPGPLAPQQRPAHGRQGQGQATPIYDPKTGLPEYRPATRRGTSSTSDSWKRPIPDKDKNVDYAKYGYKSLDELIRWRLYNRTGAGLMAELGSHQLDACSIFLGKKHPLAVTGVGGTFFYKDGREVDDHVFTIFEFPSGKDDKDRVVVTYSSINTNSFDGYGEMVMGSKGTMIVSQEKEILLYKEAGNAYTSRQTSVSVETVGKKPVLETSPSLAGPSAASALGSLATADPSRGYREELEHFAYCIRHGNASNYHDDKEHQPRCRGEVALADAVIALTTNIAMKQNRRIEFDPEWFDYKSDKTPEGAPAIARRT